MKKIKILFIEDDEVLSTMYKTKFEMEGYDVRICANGLEAVSEVTEYKPNIVFLDIMIPKIDGMEALRLIRELFPSKDDLKIIMFSNLCNDEYIDLCKEYGANDYLVKADTSPRKAHLLVKSYFTPESI